MLTGLTIRNFKVFEEASIELGNPVVFVGPNNSGKTSALQALALWDLGLRRWSEKRKGESSPQKRPGVTINRRDLLAIPVPESILLWRNSHVMQGANQHVRIDILVDGADLSKPWTCGLEFDYANPESIYCRPLRLQDGVNPERMSVPEQALSCRVAFLPPLSGLADREFVMQRGQIDFLIGQGRTAEVLRNLIWHLLDSPGGQEAWQEIQEHLRALFGVNLDRPDYVAERGEITMSYRDRGGNRLDLSCAGRGLHQTLLLLAYFATNPGSTLLLDEPDAHLEVLRQRQTYDLITCMATKSRSQVIIASHSEVILNEAANRDVVVAFLGKPHRIDDRGSQLLKSLKSIGYDHYYRAEAKGWILYLEGSTDLAILQALARILNHDSQAALREPFIHYIENQPVKAEEHFFGLKEAKDDLVGFCLCDRLERGLRPQMGLPAHAWRRREIENYICQPQTLLSYAENLASSANLGSLFESQSEHYRQTMDECLRQRLGEAVLHDFDDPYWINTKASDDFLDPLFAAFFGKLGMPNLMRKTDYHRLTPFVDPQLIPSEVIEVLDQIHEVALRASPAVQGIV